ncbi:hypothetical protein N9Z65_01070 [bacterium]|nr:hypothetical protein [bacterium]
MYKDTIAPFSFLDFITNTQADYSPEEYSSFYSQYLQNWYSNQDATEEEQQTLFKDYYRQFIKEIVLNFTTETEKRFLEKINFTDPADLDIAIPFFANRLKDIALFYKRKRDEGKYVIDKNKIKGSADGLEKAIFDNIYNFIFNTSDSLNAQHESIITATEGLGVQIEEYVDVYGDYFDVPFYVNSANNRNDIESKYFLDPAGIDAISQDNNFLTNLRSFKINPPALTPEEFDAICNPDNELVQLANQYRKGGLSIREVYTLKRALISKYLGTDIYYINTTTVPATSGILIRAAEPAANALNLQSANTATTTGNDVKLLRDVGINFKADDIGLFKLRAEDFTYSLDPTVLKQGELYIFPDPSKYGNVSTNPVDNYPLYYKYDYRGSTRNVSSGVATGDPKVTNKNTTYESYTTKDRNDSQLVERNDISYKLNFTDLYNKGLISKYKTDIYGNEYALFKDSPLNSIDTQASSQIKNLLLNGHLFFDIFEGYNFDYSATGTSGTTIKSGLSTYTNGLSALINPLTIYMREFYPYQELIEDSRNIIPLWRDGGTFTFLDGSELPNPLTGLGPGYPASTNYYYTVLAEGTFPEEVDMLTETPPPAEIRTEEAFNIIAENSTLTFETDIRFYLSAGGQYKRYEGGYFTDNVILPNDFIYSDNYRYLDSVDSSSSTIISNLPSSNTLFTKEEQQTLLGKLYIKNGAYSTSELLSSALEKTFAKYSPAIRSQINTELVDFDIIENTIFLETKSNLIIDKITYKDGAFTRPATINTTFSVNSANMVEVFTNRFYNEKTNTVYFARFMNNVTATCEPLADNYKAIYPEVYEYNIQQNTTTKLYPTGAYDVTLSAFALNDVESLSSHNYTPDSVHTPILTYNSLNNIFKLTYMICDKNDFTHLIDVSFKMSDNKLIVVNSNRYEPLNNITRTSTFGDITNFNTISSNNGSFTRDSTDFTFTV